MIRPRALRYRLHFKGKVGYSETMVLCCFIANSFYRNLAHFRPTLTMDFQRVRCYL